MDWKKANIPQGCRMFKSHNFTYMMKGATYHLVIDEYHDGNYTGHGEHSTDKNLVIESVSSQSIVGCLQALIGKIEKRS